MNEVRDNLVLAFQNHFDLDSNDATYVLNQAEEIAKTLKEPGRKANDFATARLINERVIALFYLVTEHNNISSIAAINRSYVLLVNELKKLYARNPELNDISEQICWKAFDRLEYIEEEAWQYNNHFHGDNGLSHNAQVNRLCIINNLEVPKLSPELKKIVDEADKNGKIVYAEVENTEPGSRDWYIPEYSFTYTTDGALLVNGVRGLFKVKKTQAGSASAKLLEQAMSHPNELYMPNLGHNYSRSLSVTLSGLGFSGALRDLFFPQVSQGKGIVFRPVVTRDQADSEHIDTTSLDNDLKKLGFNVTEKPISIADIPF